DLVGGKGANLGRLVRLGFPVPPGFVVTTAAYRVAVTAGQLAATDPEELRTRLPALPLPTEVSTPLLGAYRRLGATAVAVRSSGTAEDLAAASFAGQHDTFLNVMGEAGLLDAVRACWASLWSPRAVDYRRRHGWAIPHLALAVVVQVMVPAEWAGVLFTADPVSGRRDRVVLEAVPGLGEALVSGEATGHRYVVTKRGQRVLSGDAALPRHLAADLARLGQRIEAAFARPQDIEWAYANGRVVVLQARPLTALPSETTPVAARRYSRFQRAGAPNALDHLPRPPYPLDVTLYFRPLLTRVLESLRGLGLVPPPVGDVLIEVAPGVVQMVPPTVRPTLRALTLPAKLVAALRAATDPWLAAVRATLVARAEELDAEDLAPLADAAILARIEELQGLQLRHFMHRFGFLVPGLLVGLALPSLLRLAVGKRAADRLHADLLAAVPCITTEANRALGQLARQVRAAADVRAAFLTTPPDELPDRLHATAGGAAVRADIEAFLRRYGWRETAMAGAGFPAWRDEPAVVYGLLRGLVVGEQAATALDDDPERVAGARRELDAALDRRRFLRPLVVRAVAAARRSVAFREDSHFYLFLPFTVLRRLALELGQRLVARGVLAADSDIFFLELAELRPLNATDDLRERVLQRQAARRAVEDHYTAVPADLVAQTVQDGALVGASASPGRAVGSVRIILREGDFWRLQPGEVLVAPYTNPAWTPLFAVASAVVVEAGGAASHAAIVAREYGIPAVMGASNATRWLREGQRVLVDGERGRVTPLGDGT
ncbi:MAG TPA: PEP/pyruvate-binding domain-containing protein, partial [Nitrolancea sp.]|nr:PEP/pyruvate-binding domain-containing protein [Nitrolancea sp.]